MVGKTVRFKCILSHDVNVGEVIREVDNIYHVRIIKEGKKTGQYRWIPSGSIKEIFDDVEASEISGRIST